MIIRFARASSVLPLEATPQETLDSPQDPKSREATVVEESFEFADVRRQTPGLCAYFLRSMLMDARFSHRVAEGIPTLHTGGRSGWSER